MVEQQVWVWSPMTGAELLIKAFEQGLHLQLFQVCSRLEVIQEMRCNYMATPHKLVGNNFFYL